MTSSSSSTPLPSTGANTELGEVGADRIDHSGLLANREMTRAVEHQAALLLCRPGLHEAHARPHDCFADRFSIGGIVLLALEVGLHVDRRHQPHRVVEGLQLPRGARLEAN